jgi:hypothetical protein
MTATERSELLSKNEQQAYRKLLYFAMLDIRNLCQPRGSESNNPIVWRRQYRLARVAGALADWLHNLAQIAATDFNAFDSNWFWQEYHGLCRRFDSDIGPGKWIDYGKLYEDCLAELNAQLHK